MDKVLIISNTLAFLLLLYLIFVVYLYSRRKSMADFRVIIMTISWFNSLFVAFNEIILPFGARIRTFFIYDILRFSILFCMCYMYSSIVTRNLLPRRKIVVKVLAVYFWLVIIYQSAIGSILQHRLGQDYKYAFILCTDPLKLTLSIGPFTASVFFAIVILCIRVRVENAPQYLAIDQARKKARLQTILRLQWITVYFVFVSIYLIGWDLIRYLNNKNLPA